jgi:hypothetical protein
VRVLLNHIRGNAPGLPGTLRARKEYTEEDFYPLCLSLRPLFALRMAFRECETFFLGTARRNGGMRSRREGRSGIDHDDPNMAGEDKGKKAEDIAKS